MSTGRERRSTEQVVSAITAASRRQFSQLGYDGTTLRSVASEAGVALSVLQRHYPSKDALFSETVLAGLLDGFEPAWQEQTGLAAPADAHELLTVLVGDLYRHLQQHRVGSAHIVGQPAGGDAGPGTHAARHAVGRTVATLDAIARIETDRRAWLDIDDAVEGSFALFVQILGLTLIQPLLPEHHWASADADEASLIRKLSRLTLNGLAYPGHNDGQDPESED